MMSSEAINDSNAFSEHKSPDFGLRCTGIFALNNIPHTTP